MYTKENSEFWANLEIFELAGGSAQDISKDFKESLEISRDPLISPLRPQGISWDPLISSLIFWGLLRIHHNVDNLNYVDEIDNFGTVV